MHPLRIELRLLAPQANVLSIERRVRGFENRVKYSEIFFFRQAELLQETIFRARVKTMRGKSSAAMEGYENRFGFVDPAPAGLCGHLDAGKYRVGGHP